MNKGDVEAQGSSSNRVLFHRQVQKVSQERVTNAVQQPQTLCIKHLAKNYSK